MMPNDPAQHAAQLGTMLSPAQSHYLRHHEEWEVTTQRMVDMGFLERLPQGGTALTELGRGAAASPPLELGLDADGMPAPPVDYRGGLLDLLDLWQSRPADAEQLSQWLEQRWYPRMQATLTLLGKSEEG